MLLILATLAVYESRCKLRCSLNTNKIEQTHTRFNQQQTHLVFSTDADILERGCVSFDYILR